MLKKPRIMRFDKYGRELDLILLLTDNNRYTAQQIADKFGITRRNLYYYFEYLRSSGFKLIKSGATYRLDRTTAFFRRLHENISLSENEAALIIRLLERENKNDYTVASARTKLSRAFNMEEVTDPAIKKRAAKNLETLKEAMSVKKMVTIHDYSSPHSMTVSDRIVEPFFLMNDNRDIRCHEIKTHTNKTFQLLRMGTVEIIDVPWICEDQHKQVFTDMFMFSGEERHHVSLRLGQLSHNLLTEEYPASESGMTSQEENGHWTFETEVASFLGIGRFVLGLSNDITVLGDDEFKHYLRDCIKKMDKFAESLQ